MSEDIGVAVVGREKGREALARLLESQGVAPDIVEDAPLEVTPWGDALAVHFRACVFVTTAEFAAAMQESPVSDHTEGSTT